MKARPNHPAEEQRAGASQQTGPQRSGQQTGRKVILPQRARPRRGIGDARHSDFRQRRLDWAPLVRRLNLTLPVRLGSALNKKFIRMLALFAFALRADQFAALPITPFFCLTLLAKLNLALGQLLG